MATLAYPIGVAVRASITLPFTTNFFAAGTEVFDDVVFGAGLLGEGICPLTVEKAVRIRIVKI
jgi:hypothetical protein